MEWSEFARRFALELAALDRDNILIVREREESRHYVQAMREPDRLYAESVSNNFLEGPLLLTPADEEILNEAGWRPPTATWNPANWWTELSPEADHTAYTLLADMMVTALRDVQGVRRPASLVYESFHRHGTGLIELTGFGIEAADRQRITESRPAPVPVPLTAPSRPADDFEAQLSEAKQRGDHIRYFDLLIAADLVLPATGPAVEDPSLSEYATTLRDGATHVLAFTSPEAMSRSLGAHAGLHRRTTFVALAGSWPNPAWSLTVNTGLPSEISLDAAMISRLNTMHRASPEETMVDSFVLPVIPPLPTPGPPDPTPELQYGPSEATYIPAEPPFASNGTPLNPAEPPFGTPYAPNGTPYEPPHAPNGSRPPVTSHIPAESRPTTNGTPNERNEPPRTTNGSRPPIVVNGTLLGPDEAPPIANGTPYTPREPENGRRPVTSHLPSEAPPTTNGAPFAHNEPPVVVNGAPAEAPPTTDFAPYEPPVVSPTETPVPVNGSPLGPVEAPPATNGTPLGPVEARTAGDTPLAPFERLPLPRSAEVKAGEPTVPINGARLTPVDKPVAAALSELIGLQTVPAETTVQTESSAPVPLVSTAPTVAGHVIQIPHGTRLFALHDTGVEALLAIYDGASRRWARDAKVAADGYGRD
jgi:hypothetical protein